MRALRDRVGDHAIDADARQYQRKRCEDGDQGSAKSRLRDRGREALFQRADLRDRHFAIQRSDLVADCGGQSEWIGCLCLDDKKCAPPRVLGDWLIESRERLLSQPIVLDVSYDADDLPPTRFTFSALVDALANRVFTWEVSPSQRVVDHHHAQGVPGIGGAEVAPAQQARAERLEVFRADPEVVGDQIVMRVNWSPFNREVVRPGLFVRQQYVTDRRRAYARQRLHAFDKLIIEGVDLLRLSVSGALQRNLQGQDLPRIGAWINPLQTPKAVE